MDIWTRDNVTLLIAGAAFAMSAPALWISLRSAKAAEASVVEARRSADASERSATSAEGATAAAVEGVQIASASLALQQEAMAPKVDLAIDRLSTGMWRLSNRGHAPALGLALDPADADEVYWETPLGDLPRGASQDLQPRYPASPPISLRFTWDGSDGVQHIPCPPQA